MADRWVPLSPPLTPAAPATGAAPRLLDEVRRVARVMRYSLRTEEQYLQWIRDFVRFHRMRHPREMARAEVEAYLIHLAADRQVAANTQRQALSALLFLYRHVLGEDLPWLADVMRPRTKRRLPVVLSAPQVARLLGRFEEPELALFAQLLYGTGMRIAEALHLRVKDVDFAHRTLIVREGKGGKDRALMLPDALRDALRAQLQRARHYWQADRAAGRAGVWLPDALARKYPAAACSWGWHWVFAHSALSVDPRGGAERRHHWSEQRFQRAFKLALRGAGLASTQATPHTLRHYVPLRTMSRRVLDVDVGHRLTTVHSPRWITGWSGTRATCRPVDTGRPWRRVDWSLPAPAPSMRGSHPGTSASSRSTRARATAR
jgi:integron integrase